MRNVFAIASIIFLISAAFRFTLLDRIPNAAGGDELVYALTAKSVSLTGTDLSGTWHPLSALLFRYPPGEMQAELPYFVHLLFTGSRPFSLLSLRLPFAAIGSLIPIVLYLVAAKLFDRKTALVAGLIAAVNPWSVYISRTGYEPGLATFFYLAALVVILYTRGKRLLCSIPVLLLAFYSYIGTKPVLLPFAIAGAAYAYIPGRKRETRTPLLVVIISSAIIMGLFGAAILTQPTATRLSEVTGHETQGTLWAMAVKSIRTFSPDYLFLHGDNFFSLLHQGLLYAIDLPFLLVGFALAFTKRRKEFWFLTAMVGIGILPQIIHRASVEHFTPHITLAIPFLILYIAYGITEGLAYINSKPISTIAVACISSIYIASIGSFMGLYLLRHPLEGNFDFRVRLLSRYLTLTEQAPNGVTVFTNESGDAYRKHLFYANLMSEDTMQTIKDTIATKSYVFGNVRFVSCDNSIDPSKSTRTLVFDAKCGMAKKAEKRIPKLTDGGEEYAVFNDRVCGDMALRRYPAQIAIDDFFVETLPRELFCQKYVTAP